MKLSETQMDVLKRLTEAGKHPQDAFNSRTLNALEKKNLVEFYDYSLYLNGAVRLTKAGKAILEKPADVDGHLEKSKGVESNRMRLQVNMLNGSAISLDKILKGLKREHIKKVWTVYDEKKVLEYAPFNPYTGAPVTGLDDVVLVHNEGAFFESYIDDWFVKNEQFHISSRVFALYKPINLLLECEM